MPGTDLPPMVAVIDTAEEVAAMLALALREHGFRTVIGYAVNFRRNTQDPGVFLQQHDVSAIVWDIGLPYRENWEYFAALRDAGTFRGRGLVLTTTNRLALDEMVGPTNTIEVVGKPFDLSEIVAAVQRAVAGRA